MKNFLSRIYRYFVEKTSGIREKKRREYFEKLRSILSNEEINEIDKNSSSC